MAGKKQNSIKKFKQVVILDSVIFYPEHREVLNKIADKILEYPSSIPENLEKQYTEKPELFRHMKCYTQIPVDNIPLQLLMNRIEGADCVISCWANIPDEIIKLNPQLKLILFWTHEKKHRISLKLAKEKGIVVGNIPDYGTDAVSEVVFAGLLDLLSRNFSKKIKPKKQEEISLVVMQKIFDRFRQLSRNERLTRNGRFLHHFHKLGMIKFDFEHDPNKTIPEKLIENKKVGILSKNKIFDDLEKTMKSFRMFCQRFDLKDSNLADYYKFLSENGLIVYDSNEINDIEVNKLKLIAKNKLIDLNELITINYDLKKKTLGIIGLGRIGTRVAEIGKSLGMKVIYYSRTRKQKEEKQFKLKYVSLNDLMKKSDIISLHVSPHTAEGLLSKEKLKLIRKGAIFINTADGNVVDQKYLTQIMLKKHVYAYLDVYSGLPRKDVLGLPMKDLKDWKIKNLLPDHVLAYRAGWKTQESIRVKTYKLLGQMIDYLIQEKDEK